jgi:hypothetical protein
MYITSDTDQHGLPQDAEIILAIVPAMSQVL